MFISMLDHPAAIAAFVVDEDEVRGVNMAKLFPIEYAYMMTRLFFEHL